MSFFEPSPVLLALIFVQRLVYFEVLALLALLRLIVGRGAARLPAFLTLTICAVAIFTTFAPALNLQSVPFYGDAARLLATGGGAALPLATSGVFALCFLFQQRRWRWIDLLHLLGVLAFVGLWAITRV
ncbi:hypothetical protein SAMN05443551_3115 [Marivita hallyeonensis]|uniref:Uncharacterized protein n=2 Tax=Marivita hallyeonensis TaxID=996342 RepID=A0A1M5VW31_9RHOB|nr:hypothetical protein SAMN05443551_3115 [Marivita hallyeonensis]